MYCYESDNKQRLFHYTILTGWFFLAETDAVYSAVRTESSNKLKLIIVFKDWI